MKTIITKTPEESRALGISLAKEFSGGEIICLSGDLGAGKTTFTQGLLEGLGAQGPYTSPTFTIMKLYDLAVENTGIKAAHHIDAYRITANDLLELGWKDFAGKPETVTIVEWSERIPELITQEAITIHFEWISEKERKISIKK